MNLFKRVIGWLGYLMGMRGMELKEAYIYQQNQPFCRVSPHEK